jgi:hypothetical protein
MFLAGNTYGIFIFPEFAESSAPDPEKTLLRQNYFLPGSVNPPKAKEVFPPGNDEHSLTSLTIWGNLVLGRHSFASH